MPDALALLHDDHEKVLGLLSDLGTTAEHPQRRRLADEIVSELRTHTRIEEEVFYPAVAGAVPLGEGFVEVSRTEHGKAATQMEKLEQLGPDDPWFSPAAGELTRLVKEHVADEEKQLFPRVRAAMSAAQLDELGARIEDSRGAAAGGRRRRA